MSEVKKFELDSELSGMLQRLDSDLDTRNGIFSGLKTGFLDLDKLIKGFQPGFLYVIGSRYGMGKTSLALSIFVNLVRYNELERDAYYLSCELPVEVVVRRLVAAEASADLSQYSLGERDYPNILQTTAWLSGKSLQIHKTPCLEVNDILEGEMFEEGEPPSILFVDYLQLMNLYRTASKAGEIERAVSGLKQYAMEANIPVVLLTQLDRSVGERLDKRPLMSDIRPSGAIEEHADVVMLLYRDEYYNAESPDKGTADVIVCKQRGGPRGSIKLAFSPTYGRFDNLAYDDEIEGLAEEVASLDPGSLEELVKGDPLF